MRTGQSCFSPIINDLHKAGFNETYRGRAWSEEDAEWVYFDCILDVDEPIARYVLAGKVTRHDHRGTHSGAELGLICLNTGEGLMGYHPEVAPRARRFPAP